MGKYERDKLSLDNQVVKSNKMIQGKYKMSALEQKLVLTLCSKIKSDDDMFMEFTMTVNEFANFLGIDNKDYEFNRTLKRKCKILNNKDIEMNLGTKENPDWLFFHWFEYIRYIPGTATIKMKFSPVLEPYLLNLKETYTKYRLGYVINFKSEYSFRFYEIMKQYESIGERTITIEEIKDLLMIDKDKYTKYSHLKAKVIQKAIEEINKYSDIKINLEKEEKEGKKVVGLVFSINKNDYRYPVDNWLEYEKYNKKTKEELQVILDNLILARYKIHLSNNSTDLFCKEAILELIMDLKNNEFENTNIKYPIPYFTSVLQEKEKKLTGKEITKTQLRRYEIEKQMGKI
jgi:plasmid replication initiation protein